MVAEMTDRELIGYCRLHCKTERALFHADHINRMLELAGHPEYYVRRVDGWLSVHDPMEHLCDLAEARLDAGVEGRDITRPDEQSLASYGEKACGLTDAQIMSVWESPGPWSNDEMDPIAFARALFALARGVGEVDHQVK